MPIGIRTNDPGVLAELVHYLPPAWQPSTAPSVERLYSLIVGGAGAMAHLRRFNLLYANHVRLGCARELQPVLDALGADVQLYVAERARRQLFVHAGVVGWQGRTIVMPGRSFAGKTTLVAEFVRAGATYYSDEYAVFDARGRVHPYPRDLAIRRGPADKATKQSVESLGGARGQKALPVGLVLVSAYKARARWRPRRISPGQGALALLANTVAARRKPEMMLNTLIHALQGATVLQGMRGEARAVVESVLASDGTHRP